MADFWKNFGKSPYLDPRVMAQGLSATQPMPPGLVSFVPGVGDAAGLLSDVGGYIQDPRSLTPTAGLLSLAGMVPGVPNVRSVKLPPSLRKELMEAEVDTLSPDSPPLKLLFAEQLRAGAEISGEAFDYLKKQLPYHIDRLRDMVEEGGYKEYRSALTAAKKLRDQLR